MKKDNNTLSLRINEITPIIEGEGVRVGTPEVMIRCQGCSMDCKNCDSPETKSFNKGMLMSVNSVVKEVEKYNQKNVTISGGNPMEQSLYDLYELVKELQLKDYYVNMELTGSDDINKLKESLLNKVDFISFDIKTPSSGMKYEFNGASAKWAYKSQYKAVVSDWNDYKYLKDVVAKHRNIKRNKVVITPAWNYNNNLDKKFVQKLTKQILKDGLEFRLIPQTHKMIYSSTTKGV